VTTFNHNLCQNRKLTTYLGRHILSELIHILNIEVLEWFGLKEQNLSVIFFV
jgi:hypothetical protein